MCSSVYGKQNQENGVVNLPRQVHPRLVWGFYCIFKVSSGLVSTANDHLKKNTNKLWSYQVNKIKENQTKSSNIQCVSVCLDTSRLGS